MQTCQIIAPIVQRAERWKSCRSSSSRRCYQPMFSQQQRRSTPGDWRILFLQRDCRLNEAWWLKLLGPESPLQVETLEVLYPTVLLSPLFNSGPLQQLWVGHAESLPAGGCDCSCSGTGDFTYPAFFSRKVDFGHERSCVCMCVYVKLICISTCEKTTPSMDHSHKHILITMCINMPFTTWAISILGDQGTHFQLFQWGLNVQSRQGTSILCSRSWKIKPQLNAGILTLSLVSAAIQFSR